MPQFSNKSKELLSTCDEKIQEICSLAIEIMDFTIITGYRGQAQQDEDFTAGRSKLKWPNGKHNSMPSRAVDIAPYPIDWNDTARFYVLAGIMLSIAHSRAIALRWGGDWNGDFNLKDNIFKDVGHFELLD